MGTVSLLFARGVRAMTGDLHVRFVEPGPCDVGLLIRVRVTATTPPQGVSLD